MDNFYKPIQRPLQTSNLGEFTDLVFTHPSIQSMAGENNIATQILNLRNGGSINLGDHTGTVDFGLGTIGINPNDSDFSGQVNFSNPNNPFATISHSGTGLSLTGAGGDDPSAYLTFNSKSNVPLSESEIHNKTNSSINQGLGISDEVNEGDNAIQSEAVRRELNSLLPGVNHFPSEEVNEGGNPVQLAAVRRELNSLLPGVNLFP